MKKSSSQQIVYVAMSGGVDSSVSAALLKKRGFEVRGVYMNPWRPFGTQCRADQDEADARAVAKQLGIPFETWDFSKTYADKVAEPMIEAYRTGTTPNPDVGCNSFIKFGDFFKEARKRGADFIATGHYARTIKKDGTVYLRRGADPDKDQSYFLWATPAEVLPHLLIPVGGMIKKTEVRAAAEKVGLVVAKKKDSQGVCFIGQLDMKGFLKTKIPTTPGDVLDMQGNKVSTHDGAAYYTIGQRHGMDIKRGDGPFFVVAKDIQKNTITVGPDSALYGTKARVDHFHWFGPKPKAGERLLVQIRYRTKAIPATLDAQGNLIFTKPARAIAPGQSAVFYRGSRLLGGGVIVDKK